MVVPPATTLTLNSQVQPIKTMEEAGQLQFIEIINRIPFIASVGQKAKVQIIRSIWHLSTVRKSINTHVVDSKSDEWSRHVLEFIGKPSTCRCHSAVCIECHWWGNHCLKLIEVIRIGALLHLGGIQSDQPAKVLESHCEQIHSIHIRLSSVSWPLEQLQIPNFAVIALIVCENLQLTICWVKSEHSCLKRSQSLVYASQNSVDFVRDWTTYDCCRPSRILCLCRIKLDCKSLVSDGACRSDDVWGTFVSDFKRYHEVFRVGRRHSSSRSRSAHNDFVSSHIAN